VALGKGVRYFREPKSCRAEQQRPEEQEA